MKSLVFASLAGIACEVHAQFWADPTGGIVDQVGAVSQLYVDSTSSTLYCLGSFIDDLGLPGQSMKYMMQQDGVWSLSPPLGQYAHTAIRFQDTLFIGGDFTYYDGQPVGRLIWMANGQWGTAGNFNLPIWNLKSLGGELYAIGSFNTVNGTSCDGIAKRVNGNWICIPLGCIDCVVADLTIYQGRLVATGSLGFPGENYRDIIQQVNGQWEPVGEQGIYGPTFSSGGTLVVYQGDLYLGGLIDIAAGNAGHALMRWDGSAWHQVGEGLQDETGGPAYLFQVYELMVHEGKLFVAGGFDYAGHVPANRIATWDGTQWCSIGGDFGDYAVTAMAFYNDTLYVGCGPEADGQFVNGVVKFIASAFENNCSDPQSLIPQPHDTNPRLVVDGAGAYRLLEHHGTSLLEVFGPMGQLLIGRSVQAEEPFTLPGLSAGVFIARTARWQQRFVVE